MANSKISALTAQTTLADTDMLVVANSGSTTKKITALNLKKDASYTKASSFPATPATNQMCFRTDLGLLCYYDGTRWLTQTLYEVPFSAGATSLPATATAGLGYLPVQSTYDMWLVDWTASTLVLTTNNGTDKWALKLEKTNAANAATQIDAGFSTGTTPDTASNWYTRQMTLGVALGGVATWKVIDVLGTKSASAGNLYYSCSLRYRLIVT